jgi:hypothetical protein
MIREGPSWQGQARARIDEDFGAFHFALGLF